ncbi:GSCFA domain-containing protein [Flavisolibacter ginsenosidimutans]|uniref:GSCFA domain-containing protein n=1 Tax=Flavisolibacter ginsenosidimutans TaxID=661481 RepID=A0A5B8UE82_9BACT|nr:GSCFA domain-containing protein [Flavisolibacter ginsenosidimutans]QEC54977.1 GSCFA domain-containing protein [Flavisolibacter ginsenosidimutans]
MKFRFEFTIKKLPEPITHRHKLLLIGSCFTENIGEKLDNFKFTTLQNPNGILFNPVSVAEALTAYIEAKQTEEKDLFFYNEAWHSWKHHSRFSGLTADEALQEINNSTAVAHKFLKEADYLFVTLGSAWIYTLTEKATNAKVGAIAANNHKAPADWFQRKLLTTEDVLRVLDNLIHRLFLFNAKLKIIFTISPVRHLRDGVVENNRSKAVLISAVHHLVNKFDRLYYFPAYELVIDDLRDYRFYAEDLVHPNYFATQYVWEKLVDACMDGKTKELMEDIHAVTLAFKHKAFNPHSAQHKKFLQTNYEKVVRLQQEQPYLNFAKELNYFEGK